MPVSKEYVVLLHGLARTDSSMKKLAKYLEDLDYCVINHYYPSTTDTVESLAQSEIPKALFQCPKDVRIHFVTHSMGAILLRYYLSQNSIENLGRVVMLGPPNKGSQVVDKLGRVPGFKLLNGPAGMQLGTTIESLPITLPPANFDLGVIAGTKSINLLLSLILPRPNDGKVSVENTKVVGMSDHLVLPVTHTFMMNNDKVISEVVNFLQEGSFSEPLIACRVKQLIE